MLNSAVSGRSLANVTPVDRGDSSSNKGGARERDFWSEVQPTHASGASTAQGAHLDLQTSLKPVRTAVHRVGVMRTACPPPGASTTFRLVLDVTLRLEIATGYGLVLQLAPGPSA